MRIWEVDGDEGRETPLLYTVCSELEGHDPTAYSLFHGLPGCVQSPYPSLHHASTTATRRHLDLEFCASSVIINRITPQVSHAGIRMDLGSDLLGRLNVGVVFLVEFVCQCGCVQG